MVVAGDWVCGINQGGDGKNGVNVSRVEQRERFGNSIWCLLNGQEQEEISTVKDRCAAARAAGCRVIYLEQSPDEIQQYLNQGAVQSIAVQDDTYAMSLCDAVLITFGSDNPRDVHPITLDAISTPGEYWLNPPRPRDDGGNALVVEEVVDWFRAQREMDEVMGEEGCIVREEDLEDDKYGEDLSDEEMDKILADLDDI